MILKCHVELIIPSTICHLVDVDSTVENLAQHIANELNLEYPNKQLTVYAYEGVGCL